MTQYYDNLETRTVDQREQDLTLAVGKQLINAKSNAVAYADLLSDYDCESFSSLNDLESYPVTRKTDLINRQKSCPPLGGFETFNRSQIRYINVSPGPVYEACTHKPDFWRLARALFAAGFRGGDLVHNSFSYHLTPAGMMLDSGCHALGCGVIPGGVGQTEMQVQTIHDLKPDAYVGTPSFLKIVLEKADECQLDVSSIGKALVSGEALPPPLRGIFKDKGIAVLQAYATADLGVIAYETLPDTGLIIDEGVYVEIVRPGTGDRVADGEVGEVVVTSLNPDYPLIRFATGDMSTIVTGVSDCGRTNRRIKGWMGRADQTAKVRGMFIHPQQINEVVRRHPEIIKARLIVDWIDHQDEITLHCEAEGHSLELAESVGVSIRDLCKVRGDVVLMTPGSIVNDGVVIEDIRQYE
jgi:phenylacetate-CoA ligase